MCAIRMVLVDDHPIVLDGLRALLQAEAGVEIVAAVPDGATALGTIRAHQPDMAMLDISMPHRAGMAVLEALEANGSPPAWSFSPPQPRTRRLRRL